MAHGGIQEYIKYQEYIRNKNFTIISKGEIKPNDHKSAKDFIDEPFHPNDLILSIFAATVYREKVKDGLIEGLEALKEKKGITEHVKKIIEGIQHGEEWRLLAWGENTDDDYFGAAFWNARRNQLVISHRGTVPKKTKTALADMEGVIRKQYTSQIHSACAFLAWVLRDLDQHKIQISITGHSLGAWLAQITTFTAEYLTLEQEIFTGRKGKLRDPRTQIHAVVLDSPGCYEILCQMAGHYFDKYEHEAHTLISALDITIYFNIPNLVNSVNSHHGISRLLQIRETSEDVTLEKNITWYDLDSHKAINFIRMLSSIDNVNIWTVLNWPSFEFPHAVKKKKSNKPLTLSKSMVNIIKLIFSSVEVLMSPENELVEYYKRMHELGTNDEERNIGGISNKHKIIELDQKCRNVSIFSEEQIAFLKYWKRVKNEKVAAEKFENIQKILNNNNLEQFNDFLPFFEFRFDESNKKVIRCDSGQDLDKIIRRVKHLLAEIPQAFDRMKKDAEELLKSYETLYKSHSEKYLQTLPCLDVDFIDIYNIQEFLESKEKVLALITKNEIKYEIFRVRNLLRQNDHGQCYLSLSELEQIVQHVDVKIIFEDAECRVDSILILDCEAKVGGTMKEVLQEFIKTAKNSKQNAKKLILVGNDNDDWLKNMLDLYQIRTDEVQYSFLDFTEETKLKIFMKKIVTLWNKKMNLAKFLNVTDSKESVKEQIDFLSHPEVLFSLLNSEYANLELSSQNVINHDNLKVLTVDLQKEIELKWLSEFLKTKPNDLEKIFGKPILFMLTGILKTDFQNHFEKDLPHVKFEEDDSTNFTDLCRKNMFKRIYWIHFSNNLNSIELRKIFDPDFYIERRILKQIIINKTMFSRLLNEGGEISEFIVYGITRENFFELLDINPKGVTIETLSPNLEIMNISTNVVAIGDSIDEAANFFHVPTKLSVHFLRFTKCCEKFIWECSKGPLKTIRNITSFDYEKGVLTELDLTHVPDNVVIIAGESGVGKSTILLRYAKKLTSAWVIWVKLVDYRKKFPNIDSKVNLDNIAEFLLKCNENSLNPFTKLLLKFNLTHETKVPVVIFFDGFDEIVIEDIQRKMVDIFKFLKEKTNARIWITTKIWAKNMLEDELSVFSTKIEEVGKNQQKRFIKNFWLAGSYLNMDSKHSLDNKAVELFTKSEQSLVIQRHLSARDCIVLEGAWKLFVNRHYESELLDDLIKYKNTIYQLSKNGQHQSMEGNIARVMLELIVTEKAHKKLIEFINILHFAWFIDQPRNIFSQRYLKKYVELQSGSTGPSEEELARKKLAEIFIEILLISYKDEANNQQIHDILEIPLQLRMMGEILQRQNESMAKLLIPENLLTNLYGLYKEFISIKFNIYTKEKLKKKDDKKSSERTLGQRHQCLAIQLLFPDQYEDILDGETLNLTDESWKEDTVKMNQIGIIDLNNSGTFTFNHISFAEYFTADKIFNFLQKKNLSNPPLEDLIMTDILLMYENIMIRKFLDGMLTNKDVVFKFFEKKFSPLTVNESGESALHMCASENLINLAAALLRSFKNESSMQKFMGVYNTNNETALHYTAANNQLELGTLLLRHRPEENIIQFEMDQVSDLFQGEELPLRAKVCFSFSIKDVSIFLVQDNEVSDIRSCENIPELLNLVLKFDKMTEMSDSSLYVLLKFAIKHESAELALLIMNKHPDSLAKGPISKLFHHASKKGLRSVVLQLLEAGADINTIECECQSTPLYLAAKNGHWDLVEELVDLEAKVDIKSTKNEKTVLQEAAFSGRLDIILKLLAKGADINAVEQKNNYSPITAAAAKNHWDVVLKLLEFGADPSIPALETEMTAMHFALFQKAPSEIIVKLLDKGASINAIETSAGYTPMMSAAVEKRWDVVLELITRGADVDVPTYKYKRTVLHFAAIYGAKEVVISLLEAGADINAKELTNGVVAINMAAENDQWDTVLELIRRGADVNVPVRDSGNAVLHFAVGEEEINVVVELLKHGANINAINNYNWTPLNLAAEENKWDIVSKLLQHGANIDAIEGGRKHLFKKAEAAGKLEWLTEIVLGE